MDTWLLLRNIEIGGERNRVLYVLKSRGMAHSNQVREFVLSDKGINLVPIYTGAGTVLTGSARLSQESREAAETMARQQGVERRRREIERERQVADAQAAALRAGLDSKVEELNQEIAQETLAEQNRARAREEMAARRGGNRKGG